MAIRFLLQVVYQTGQNLYAVIRNAANGQVWNTTLNTGAGGFEVYNSANWAQYAIALTEQTSSGFYSATYPAAISGVLTCETFYQRAGGSPTLGDAPAAGLARNQGDNLAAVAGDAVVPDTLQQALDSEELGAAAGTPTTLVIPTNLSSALVNAYAGRAVVFTSGAAFQCVGRIATYNPTNGVLTLTAPLAAAPAAGDKFVIV